MTAPGAPSRSRRGGFTLLEILIAMSLFTVIGLGVVLLMRTGVEMYVQGTEGSQQEDRLEQSLPRLEDDLRHVLVPPQIDRIPFDPKNPDPQEEPEPLPPANRFLSGYLTYKFGDKDIACRYLAFVRDTTGMGEVEIYADRAGQSAHADAYIDGWEDEREFRENRHLPTGGAAEVLYIWLPDEDRAGVGAVYRAYRSPIGGEGTLLDPKNYDTREKVVRLVRGQPVFQDVILFDLYFWTQWTTHWEWSAREPVVTRPPADPSEIKSGSVPCGPSLTWDSTRGVLPVEQFRLAKGQKSLTFSADDIWPHGVRVAYALAETSSPLAKGYSASDTSFTVFAGDFATGRGEIRNVLMKVGTEWVEVAGRDPSHRDTFRVTGRGIRGTSAVAHAEGEPVYFGRVFDFTMPIPS
ncbi:MAG TPA: prepilin-type N-terminal cleavage/methylation domain-containing protein, partial [Planctomycetota bacterium]|nr:prepilin-type N-terminal cleavage/methylation domain-containing protein [Planctomycetota bacterium]